MWIYIFLFLSIIILVYGITGIKATIEGVNNQNNAFFPVLLTSIGIFCAYLCIINIHGLV